MDLVESKQRIVPAENRHPWELARLDAVRQVIREFAQLQPGGYVVDVGCGDAFFVAQLAKEYPEVNFVAVDTALSEEFGVTLHAFWGVPNLTMHADLESANRAMKGGKASLVLLLDVIEHIEHDIRFLDYLKSFPFFTEETTLVITVPAYQGLFCTHDVYLGHFRRYRNEMLEDHVIQAGLRPVKTVYFFTSLLAPRILQVWRESLLRDKPKLTTGLVEWRGSRLVGRMLKAALLLDFRVSWMLNRFGVKLPGLSNLTVCRKRSQAAAVTLAQAA
jgi:trans-aconitate methyltransferase